MAETINLPGALQTTAHDPQETNAVQVTPTQALTLPGEPRSLTPLTDRAAQSQFMRMRPVPFEERNVQAGIPLSAQEGLSTWDRLVLSTRRAEDDQLRYLRTKYGPDKVRRADTGEWIVRVTDPDTGKPKDIVADPHRLDLGDVVSIAGDVPEIAGYIYGSKLGKMLPLIGQSKGLVGMARNIVTGAAGAETAGAAKDIAVRAGEAPIDLGEIAGARAKRTALDIGVGAVMEPIANFIQFVKAPGAGRAETQVDMINAKKYFRDNYGVDVPLTVGQTTGNPDIIRREKFTGKVLGGSRTYQAFERDQNAAMDKLQQIMQGSDISDDEVLGRQIIDALQQKTAPVTGAVTGAASALGTEAQRNIESLLGSKTLAQSNLTQTQVGEIVRNGLIARRDAAKAEADRLFGDFRALTGDQPFIPGNSLADAATQIKKDAASAFKQKPSPIVGPSGTPTSTVTEQVPSGAFVPETSIMRRLNELIENKDASYRFSDLQKMRSDVYDDLAKSEAVPGLGPHYLSRIGQALTDAMEGAAASAPSPAAKDALLAANKFYRENVVPFNRKGVSELFKNEFEPGYIGSAQLAQRITGGGAEALDRFNTLKTALGPTSPEFGAVKQSITDDLLARSALPGQETLDAKKFLNNLSEFITNPSTREIASEIIGPKARNLLSETAFLKRAQEGDKFSADEMRKWLVSGSSSESKLEALLKAERERDKVFSGKMMEAIANNSTTGLELTPEDVVNRFLNKPERNLNEVRQTLALLSDRPALVEDIRTHYLENLFRQADDAGRTVTEALSRANGDEKARTILGSKLFDDLDRYGMLQTGIKEPSKYAESAGAFAGSKRIDELMVKPVMTLTTAAREWVTAKVLTSPMLRNWAMRLQASEPGALQLILTSAPFVESVTRNFGPGKESQNLIQGIKRALDENLAQQTGTNTPRVAPQKTVTLPGTVPTQP